MTTCQNYTKFIADDYLQMYKTWQLCTSLFIENYKHVQKYTNIFTNTKVTKYAKFIKA